jgi:hypothetical protein
MFDTPILYLIFNRLDSTEITFSSISKIKPKKLFIAADGPRIGNEFDEINCRLVREFVLLNINWDCEVQTLFRDNNLGCGKAVSSAITWFFSKVEQGIILEDDCLASNSFFYFCENLLDKYTNNNKITHIGGHNQQCGYIRNFSDYYFSKFSNIWGWATWKRAWDMYDFNEMNFKELLVHPESNLFPVSLISDLIKNNIDTWDIQWVYYNFINNNFSIIPNFNLVDNIGFNSYATHTKFSKPGYFKKNNNRELYFPLDHPKRIKFNKIADEFTASYIHKTCKPSLKLKLYNKLTIRYK